MFTLPELEIIMSNGKNEMIELMRAVGFEASASNWPGGFDSFITQKVCSLMKSESVIEGYSFLLRAANIPSSYSDTPNEKLASIIAHKDEIIAAITSRNDAPRQASYESRFYAAAVSDRDLLAIKNQAKNLKQRAESIPDGRWTPQEYIDLKKKALELYTLVQSLPDTVIIPPKSMTQYSESEITGIMTPNAGKFLVSVSREEVQKKPDISSQYRKFTPDEASMMLDVLEKIYAVVKKL